MKAFAVGFISYSNEMYPEPNGKNKTWAIFVNESNAIEWSKQHGGKLKIRPVDVSLKFTRPTSGKLISEIVTLRCAVRPTQRATDKETT